MKKYLTLGIISLLSSMSFAQGSLEPVVIQDATARKISKDGKWVACYGMSILMYNVETKESEIYPECSLGIGNAVALDGTTVGSFEDESILMKGGQIISPEILSDYGISGINAINSSANLVTGYVRNPVLNGDENIDPFEEGITVFLPFYAELTPNGSIEKINILPYPEKDFLGFAPMYVTGDWISEDGKTILGKMTDSYGRFEDPIVFIEDEAGEWSYLTPTRELNNPDGIVLPENPWINAPEEPVYKDYMTQYQYMAYMDALEKYLFGGGPEVDPFQFMSEDMIEKYLKDYDEYENYFDNHIAEIDAYEEAYRKILETSMYFRESALDPYGKTFASTAVNYDDESFDVPSKVFIFNAQTGEYQRFESQYSGLKIHQVLSDGTILAYTGLFTYEPLNGYIYLPGEKDFMPFADYMAVTNPDYADWLVILFPNGEGIISASDDLSVVAGGVDVLSTVDEYVFPDSTILSYILPAVKEAGVEGIEMPFDDGIYRVFNMMGIKVMETKDKSDLNNLGKGIYIINGKKIAL